jgi:Zn-dependent protease/tetratricopeptide (TPR) repeat protein
MDLALIIISVWIFSTCFHEFGHAITAYWGGDKSVKDKGYLTLNPFVYINSATTLVLPVLALMLGGIALPGAAVSINTSKIKNRFMLSFVSFAGPLFTFIFLMFLVIFLKVLPSLEDTIGNAHVYQVFERATCTLIYLHVFVFLLNLLPLPPLDGYGILEPFLPAPVRHKLRQYSNIGFLVIMGLFFFCDPFSDFMRGLSRGMALEFGAPWSEIRYGFRALTQNSFYLLGVLVIAFIAKGKFGSDDEKAQKLMNAKKFEEALPLYKAALAKQPNDPRLIVAVAACCLGLGRREEALEYAETAIKLDPENAQACGIAAACLSDLGRPEAALEMTERAIKYDTNQYYPFTHIVKAAALNSLGRYQEALDAAEVYVKNEKNPGEGLIIKAAALENLERYEDALAVYNKASRSTAGSSLHLQLAKGMLLCSMSKTTEGLAEFDKLMPKDLAERTAEVAKLKELLAEKADELDKHGKQSMAAAMRQAINQLK